MIEIVYSDSVYGTILASDIEHNTNQICIVDLMLDIGFLDKEYDSEYRRNLYRKMYSYSFPELNPKSKSKHDDMGTYFDKSVKSIKNMIKKASKGETIRIWADLNARGQCCTAFICNTLLKIKGLGKVVIMNQPQFNYMDKSVYFCFSWGSFDQWNAKAYLPLQRTMTSSEMKFYSDEWERMKKENSVLRTIICNRLESVSEDFYDNTLLKYVSDEPTKEINAIGNFLGDKMYGLNSLLPPWRFQRMIEQGIIEVVEKADSKEKILCRKIKRIK